MHHKKKRKMIKIFKLREIWVWIFTTFFWGNEKFVNESERGVLRNRFSFDAIAFYSWRKEMRSKMVDVFHDKEFSQMSLQSKQICGNMSKVKYESGIWEKVSNCKLVLECNVLRSRIVFRLWNVIDVRKECN